MAKQKLSKPDIARVGASLPSTQSSLAFALLRARERVMTPIRVMLSGADITEQQWRVLRVLEEFGPLEASKLAENACLLLPSQTRIVQNLVVKGLVVRQNNPNDRRKHTIEITEDGKKIIEENLDEAAELARNLERVMGKDGIENLLKQLKVLDDL